jgi:hypothetical protein
MMIGFCGIVLACDNGVAPSNCPLPDIVSSQVSLNPDNVLSARVTAKVKSADSITVRFGLNASALDSVTPATVSPGDSVDLPVLALSPVTSYVARVVAFNQCGTREGKTLSFTTNSLPADLPTYASTGTSPLPGYVVFRAGMYGVAVNNSGRVVWYHRFAVTPGISFQPQLNGRYVAHPVATGNERAEWVEIDPNGDLTRTRKCGMGLSSKTQDLLTMPDGSYWIICEEVRTVDLSADGGPSAVKVLGDGVQHISASGNVLFAWSSFDHLAVDMQSINLNDLVGDAVNWTHANGLDIDTDGNVLLSFRNISQVIKINSQTGAVIWRMGGLRNQFTFENGATPPFVGQHGVRSNGPGRLIVLDNLGDANMSHAERYEYDEAKRTARLVDSFAAPPGIIGRLGGSTQTLPDGHTLVSFGNGGSVQEFDSAGRVVWQLDPDPGYVFRAIRIHSLYKPGVGDPR